MVNRESMLVPRLRHVMGQECGLDVRKAAQGFRAEIGQTSRGCATHADRIRGFRVKYRRNSERQRFWRAERNAFSCS